MSRILHKTLILWLVCSLVGAPLASAAMSNLGGASTDAMHAIHTIAADVEMPADGPEEAQDHVGHAHLCHNLCAGCALMLMQPTVTPINLTQSPCVTGKIQIYSIHLPAHERPPRLI